MVIGSRLPATAALLFGSVFVAIAILHPARDRAPAAKAPHPAYGYFVANQGQFDAAVAFSAASPGEVAYVTRSGGLVTAFEGWHVTEHLPPGPAPRGDDTRGFNVSYFRPGQRVSGAPAFGLVELGERWPGVSLAVRAAPAGIERLFHVAPGADAGAIRVRVEGAAISPLADGGIELRSPAGTARLSAPIAFQQDGARVEVAYAVADGGYGFAVGAHDASQALTIDPVLNATYLGGDSVDSSLFNGGLAINGDGEVVFAVAATNADFPGAAPPVGDPLDDGDFIVARMSADLGDLLAVTFVGGSGNDSALGIALDATDRVVIGGTTYSTDLPGTAGGYQATHNTATPGSPEPDGFAMILSADLSQLVQTTYFGTASTDYFGALALMPGGEVLLGGATFATSVPGTTGAAQPTGNGTGDALLVLLNADLTGIVRSTFYVTGVSDAAIDVDVATDGSIYALISSEANSSSVTPTVVRFSSDLTSVVASRALASTAGNYSVDLEVAASGDLYALGQTDTGGVFGTTGGAQSAPDDSNNSDCFVSRLPADLSAVTQATYLGSDTLENCNSLLTTADAVYVGGSTPALDFPALDGGYQTVPGSPFQDVFVTQLALDLQSFVQSSYFGASDDDLAPLLAEAANGDLIMLATTIGDDLEVSADAFQTASAGLGELFLMRMDSLAAGAGSDHEPNAYEFTDPTGASPGSLVTSNAVTITGVNPSTLANAYVESPYEAVGISVNGDAFVAKRRSIPNGATVRLRIMANGSKAVSVNIGGVQDTWVVTAAGSTPNVGTFRDTSAPPDRRVSSNAVTLSGFTDAVTVSVVNHPGPGLDTVNRTISINSAPASRFDQVAESGDTVRLWMNSPPVIGQSNDFVVSIGGQQQTWTVTAAESSGGGGGALSHAALLGLLLGVVARRRQAG